MRPAPRTHRSPRPGFRHLTTVATLALAAGLLVPGPASAQPRVQNSTDDSASPTLPAGSMVGLAPGARNVQVQESPGGATVAVLWQNPGATQVWARIKTRGTWRKKVRLSPARARATQPSMDLDSDGHCSSDGPRSGARRREWWRAA